MMDLPRMAWTARSSLIVRVVSAYSAGRVYAARAAASGVPLALFDKKLAIDSWGGRICRVVVRLVC